MKNLNDELQFYFTNLNIGQCMKLESLPEDAVAWVLMDSYQTILVAIPCSENLEFNENFAGVAMRTTIREISGKKIKLLSIASDQYESREQFTKICCDFLAVESRKQIVGNPSEWWDRWKQLLGNRKGEVRPYPVIGELLTWKWILEAGIDATWSGPEGSTHDVETSKNSFEVKSTIERTGASVTISSQHQLSAGKGKKLFLVLNRLESIDGTLSLNSLSEDLLELGVNEVKLETQLSKLGFPKGRIARAQTYRLLESLVFEVDDNFPRIVEQSFKGDKFPEGVVKLTYDIDLANLAPQTSKQFFSDLTATQNP